MCVCVSIEKQVYSTSVICSQYEKRIDYYGEHSVVKKYLCGAWPSRTWVFKNRNVFVDYLVFHCWIDRVKKAVPTTREVDGCTLRINQP
jgi:hypothetical protein